MQKKLQKTWKTSSRLNKSQMFILETGSFFEPSEYGRANFSCSAYHQGNKKDDRLYNKQSSYEISPFLINSEVKMTRGPDYSA